MELKINISLDNAAFSDSPMLETNRILKELARRLLEGEFGDHGDKIALRDINGNEVGEAVFVGEDVYRDFDDGQREFVCIAEQNGLPANRYAGRGCYDVECPSLVFEENHKMLAFRNLLPPKIKARCKSETLGKSVVLYCP